jgi:hypothetical protein
MRSLVRAWGNSSDIDALIEPTRKIQAITASKMFAVFQVWYGPYHMFKTDQIFHIFCCFSLSRRPSNANFYHEIAAWRRCRPKRYYHATITMCHRLRVLCGLSPYQNWEVPRSRWCNQSYKFCVDWFNRFGSIGDRISGSPIGSVNGPLAHRLAPPRCRIIHSLRLNIRSPVYAQSSLVRDETSAAWYCVYVKNIPVFYRKG